MKKDKYIIYSDLNDFYLGDAIYRNLLKDNKEAELFYRFLPDSYTVSQKKFISIINDEVIKDEKFVSLIAEISTDNSVDIILLENQSISSYPNNWREILFINATKGLNKEILETIEDIAKKPVGKVRNLENEYLEAQKEEQERLEQERIIAEEAARQAEKEAQEKLDAEKRIYVRTTGPANFQEAVLEDVELTGEVKKGLKYLLGDGLPQDGARAYSILRKAANDSDDWVASYYYALCLSSGISGLEKEEAMHEALKAFSKAADHGMEQALVAMGVLLMENDPENDQVTDIFLKLKEINPSKGLYYLGYLDERKKNYADALEKYYEASEEGSPEAQNALGYMYGEGWGVEVDEQKSRQWFELACAQGLPQAKLNLGMIYVGSGEPELVEKGISMVREAAETGYVDAVGVYQEMEQLLETQRKEEEKKLCRKQNMEAAKRAFMGALGDVSGTLKSAASDLWNHNDEYKKY